MNKMCEFCVALLGGFENLLFVHFWMLTTVYVMTMHF